MAERMRVTSSSMWLPMSVRLCPVRPRCYVASHSGQISARAACHQLTPRLSTGIVSEHPQSAWDTTRTDYSLSGSEIKARAPASDCSEYSCGPPPSEAQRVSWPIRISPEACDPSLLPSRQARVVRTSRRRLPGSGSPEIGVAARGCSLSPKGRSGPAGGVSPLSGERRTSKTAGWRPPARPSGTDSKRGSESGGPHLDESRLDLPYSLDMNISINRPLRFGLGGLEDDEYVARAFLRRRLGRPISRPGGPGKS